jgi:hypothetical protein
MDNEESKGFSVLRQTYMGNLVYHGLKYSTVVYYIFLAMYCIVADFSGIDRVSSLAILPYVYSYISPAMLLLVVLVVRFTASYLYRDGRFRSNYVISVVTILIAILMVYLPNTSGLYDMVLRQTSFQWVDFLLLTLSLWDVAIGIYFSTQRSDEEVEVLLGWLKRIDEVAIKGILIQFAVMAVPYLTLARFLKGADLQGARIGLFFLSFGYFSIAFIRMFTVVSQGRFGSLQDALLKKLLEMGIYAKENDVHGEKKNSDGGKDT